MCDENDNNDVDEEEDDDNDELLEDEEYNDEEADDPLLSSSSLLLLPTAGEEDYDEDAAEEDAERNLPSSKLDSSHLQKLRESGFVIPSSSSSPLSSSSLLSSKNDNNNNNKNNSDIDCHHHQHRDDDYSYTMMLTDIATKVGNKREGSKTIVLLYGRTTCGRSVCLQALDWSPHLLFEAPPELVSHNNHKPLLLPEHAHTIKQGLEDRMNTMYEERISDTRMPILDKLKQANADLIVDIELVMGKTLLGYQAGGNVPFIKVFVGAPALISILRDCLEGYEIEQPEHNNNNNNNTATTTTTNNNNKQAKKKYREGLRFTVKTPNNNNSRRSIRIEIIDKKTQTFESNIDPCMQFLVDASARGCQWLKLPKHLCSEAPSSLSSSSSRSTSCDLEASVPWTELEWIDLNAMSLIPPLRILSYDIEAAGRKGVFPDHGIDPVIQIAIQFHIYGQQQQSQTQTLSCCCKPILLNLRGCLPIEDAEVICYGEHEERDMVCDFAKIVKHFDPDLITGYNICNFDFPYLEGRAKAENRIMKHSDDRDMADSFRSAFSRTKYGKMHVIENFFESAQAGKVQRNHIQIPGRTVFDMYNYFRNIAGIALPSYKLDYVAKKFCGDQKEDVHFTEITPMWNSGDDKRRDLGVYCLKDASLPIDLMLKTDAVLNVVGRARVAGLPCDWILRRGTMVQFNSLLLRHAGKRNLFVPHIKRAPTTAATIAAAAKKKSKYTGATVLDVVKGLHPYVGVADFSAMYPSIMIAHNLCYSTYLLPGASAHGPIYEAVRSHKFVSADTSQGIIPEILRFLVAERKRAKKESETADDPMKRLILHYLQLGLKVACNSIYGAIGCENALLPLKAIAETVTATGRKDIERVQSISKTIFTRQNGFPGEATVVCGDTDSVFVCMDSVIPAELKVFQRDAIAETIRLTLILVKAVNEVMEPPKQIDYEKVYVAILCMRKKGYAGTKVVSEKDEKFTLDIKGVECVRRDGCPLIQRSVREALEIVVYQCNVDEACAYVRKVVQDVIEDKVPPADYAVKKTLRKTYQDCCFPLSNKELREVRAALEKSGFQQNPAEMMTTMTMTTAAAADQQLTYTEVDNAIRARIKLPFKIQRLLPHIMVAWKMRREDPGRAPVPGENVSYIVTLNGGKKIAEKADTVENVSNKALPVDRRYYLDKIQKIVSNIFSPIFWQEAKAKERSKKGGDEPAADLNAEVESMLRTRLWWQINKPLVTSTATKKQRMEASPLFQAFKRSKPSSSSSST